MARTVNAREYAERRAAILDAAQALIYAKGYDQMTIQDLLDALQISKGAFYHYFASKPDLLEALIGRMVEQMMDVLRPVVADDQLSAVAKLESVSRTAVGWKNERIGVLAALMGVWLADANALVRDKLSRASLEQFGVLLQAIVEQGIAEGAMSTDYPDLAGGMVMSLLRSMSDEVLHWLMVWDQVHDGPRRIARAIAACSNAIERLLCVAPGTLRLAEPATLHTWGEVLSARR